MLLSHINSRDKSNFPKNTNKRKWLIGHAEMTVGVSKMQENTHANTKKQLVHPINSSQANDAGIIFVEGLHPGILAAKNSIYP